MFRFLLLCGFLSLVVPPMSFGDTPNSPVKIWGWFEVKARVQYTVMEDIMSTLAGEHYFIRYLHLPGIDEPVTILCLSASGMKLLGGIAKHKGETPLKGHAIDRVAIHYVLQGHEEDVSEVIRILHIGGFLGYVMTNIDDFFVIGNVMKCPLRPAQCLGGSCCDFVKAVTLSTPDPPSAGVPQNDPFGLASLLVHEAAHLERCYDDEDYAWSQEERFKSSLFGRLSGKQYGEGPESGVLIAGLLARSRIHFGSLQSEPTPLEDFIPPFVIEPKRLRRAL